MASDIDLFIVHSGEAKSDTYALVKKTLNTPRLEPHLYNSDEYQRLQPTLDKMIEKGVLLYSIEETVK